MIDFPIVDAHLHVCDLSRFRYPWVDDIPLLQTSFGPDDYKKACRPVDVEKMVFIQYDCIPSQYKAEVAWVTSLAENVDPRIQGIVSWAPLERGEAVRPEIEALKQNKLVKGIRRIIQFEKDIDFCLREDFIKGVQLLSDYDMTFDICIAPRNNINIIKLVEKCPDNQFILDHIGKPDIKGNALDPWRSQIRELSRMQNVFCKVSSLATEADHEKWTLDDLRPFVDHIFDCFGFDRTIFGGDWPVSLMAAVFPKCVQTLEMLIEGCTQKDKRKLFRENAIRFYKL